MKQSDFNFICTAAAMDNSFRQRQRAARLTLQTINKRFGQAVDQKEPASSSSSNSSGADLGSLPDSAFELSEGVKIQDEKIKAEMVEPQLDAKGEPNRIYFKEESSPLSPPPGLFDAPFDMPQAQPLPRTEESETGQSKEEPSDGFNRKNDEEGAGHSHLSDAAATVTPKLAPPQANIMSNQASSASTAGPLDEAAAPGPAAPGPAPKRKRGRRAGRNLQYYEAAIAFRNVLQW